MCLISKPAAALLAALIVALTAGCSGEGDRPRRNLRAAPDFTLTSLDGETIRLSDYRGKVVLLTFWATWCEPCVAAMPDKVEMQKKYGPEGLIVLGLSLDRKVEDVREFLAKNPLNFPVLMLDSKTREAYGGIPTIPYMVIVDRDGTVRRKKIGYTEEDRVSTEEKIQSLIGEEATFPAGS